MVWSAVCTPQQHIIDEAWTAARLCESMDDTLNICFDNVNSIFPYYTAKVT